ncbi:MAG TPA: class I SAM-dependent methyltransferase [Mycobacteriales bacterium]|nr:class I SAM-dependent methyltransferase [Mycobacteriales bacterium]
MDQVANVEMAQAWNGPEGEDWARDWERYDKAVQGYHRRLLGAAAGRPGERALDVGCGNGQVARDLATAGLTVLGVDLSAQMVERGKELAAELPGADFLVGDAQVHPFDEGAFDLVVSRFGAMFFADRPAAFRNLARATRPGGRVALVAWQPIPANEWLMEIRGALALGRDLPSPPIGAAGPFGLADPDETCATLREAGYGDASATATTEGFWAGRDPDDAYAFLSRSGVVRGLLEALPPEQGEEGLAALRAVMEAHATGDGVVLGSAAWLYTGTRNA